MLPPPLGGERVLPSAPVPSGKSIPRLELSGHTWFSLAAVGARCV